MKRLKVAITAGILLVFSLAVATSCTPEQYPDGTSGAGDKENPRQSILFYVTDEGLYAMDIETNDTIIIDDNPGISSKVYPLKASPDGNYIAYTADDVLFIAKVDFDKNVREPMQVFSGDDAQTQSPELSYAWFDDTTLIYSAEGEGFFGVYNAGTRESITEVYEQPYYYYKDFVLGADGNIYAEKYIAGDENGEVPEGYREQWIFESIVSINPDSIFFSYPESGEQKIVVEGSDITSEDMGAVYEIAAVSPDKSKLFIWCHSYSGSMTADGVRLMVYDIGEDVLKVAEDDLSGAILMYGDNIAFNPADSNLAALNMGASREMGLKKQIEILNINEAKTDIITGQDQVTMSPVYSQDGQRLIYAAGKTLASLSATTPGSVDYAIFEMDLQTGVAAKLTEPEQGLYDLRPQFANDDKAMIFARCDDNQETNLFMMRRTGEGYDSAGAMLIEKIKTPDTFYYGHIDFSPYFTIYQKR